MEKRVLLFIIIMLTSVTSNAGWWKPELYKGIRYEAYIDPGNEHDGRYHVVVGEQRESIADTLTRADIPDYFRIEGQEWGYEVVGIHDNAFKDCKHLTTVTLPNTLTYIGKNAFANCISLTSINIPSNVNQIMEHAFYGCGGLKSITVDEGNSTYDSRDNCNAIIETATNTLIRGCAETRIPNSVTQIGDYAFNSCRGLTSVFIPKGIEKIGYYVFADCPDITSIIVDEENSHYNSRENCNAIIETERQLLLTGCAKTTIPDGVTSIADGAFWGATNLFTVTIPSSVSMIWNASFFGCRLKSVLTKSTKVTLSDNHLFGGAFSDATYQHTMLYIPQGSWFDAVYNSDWYRFNNIREVAMETSNLSGNQAYMLMKANSHGYLVYDSVNDKLKEVDAHYNVNESMPDHCWQLTTVNGKPSLYNIGAKKYAQMNSEGNFTLTSQPTELAMTNGKNGITIGGDNQTQWDFVLNNIMSVEKDVTKIVTSRSNDALLNTRYYTLEGQENVSPRKGVNIVHKGNGQTIKVVITQP